MMKKSATMATMTSFSSDLSECRSNSISALHPWLRKTLTADEFRTWEKAVAVPQVMENISGFRVAIAFNRSGWNEHADMTAEEKLLACMIGHPVVMAVDEQGRLFIDKDANGLAGKLDPSRMVLESGALLGHGAFMDSCAGRVIGSAIPWLEVAAERLQWSNPVQQAWKRKLRMQLRFEWRRVKQQMFGALNQDVLAHMFKGRIPMSADVYHWLLGGQGKIRHRRLSIAGKLGVWLWYALEYEDYHNFLSELDSSDDALSDFSDVLGVDVRILQAVAAAFGRTPWSRVSRRLLGRAIRLWRKMDSEFWPTHPVDMRASLGLMDLSLLLYSDYEDICEDAVLAQMQWARELGWQAADRLVNRRDGSPMDQVNPGSIFSFWCGPMAELADKVNIKSYACAPLNIQMQWSDTWMYMFEAGGEKADHMDAYDMVRRAVFASQTKLPI